MRRLRADYREIVAELLQYHELLYSFVWRDLRLRYKQTAMGFAWSVMMPVFNMIIFTIIFTRVAPLEVPMPYPVFAFVGLLPWNFFAASLRFSLGSLVGNSALVTKVYFPREILPLSAVLVSLVDFAVGGLVLVGLMVYYGLPVSSTILLLPLIILVQVVFTTAIALTLAMANLFFRDVKYLFEPLIMIWMLTTSVVYPMERLGGTLGTILRLNPMTPIIDAYRDVIVYGRVPPAGPLAYAAAVSITGLALAWVVFHRAEYVFAENI